MGVASSILLQCPFAFPPVIHDTAGHVRKADMAGAQTVEIRLDLIQSGFRQ